MNTALITCSPDATISQAARMMCDGDTGDVLVTENGKLKGIVTDRDVTMYLAKHEDAVQATVDEFMSKDVITGETDWDIDKVADKMKKHQIRRLPIMENDRLVGIVSFGDLARHDDQRKRVADTMRHISEPRKIHRAHAGGRSWVWGILGMVFAVTTVILTRSPKTLRSIQEQVEKAHPGEKASDLFERVEKANLPEKATDLIERGRDEISKRVADNRTMYTRSRLLPRRLRKWFA